ncbi:VOC family protein [Dongia soli]|uniref:VOC family protein n=1 Tax=Dongia soli TaxID=600628 RepID=A0ABU5E9Z4_9PROT|nr:VOC family protein [Dongia soli]MDY0883165.1 VOC family protein [Dongia soli]
MASNVKAIPDGYRSITPYLVVDGGMAAVEFYKKVFGAVERLRVDRPGGKIGHTELMIGDSVIMMADEYPEMNARGPKSIGGSPVSLVLYVPDVDAVAKKAVEAGGTLERPVETKFYGDRMGTIKDPFGHIWHIATHVEDVSPEELQRRAKEMASCG